MESEPEDLDARIAALERELEELRASLPRHSVKPSQLLRIEEVEDELARLRAIRQQRLTPPAST
jgi:ribosomal protein L29